MRIESTPNRSSNPKFTANKKHNKKKQQESTHESHESLELSEECLILNKLLYATSNQFIPNPFYFANAAARNIKQACTISKNIQNQALSMGITLNYSMIYDMVTDLANQNYLNNIQWTNTLTPEHEALNNSEKSLFEDLHNACVEHQTTVRIIETTALEYIRHKQTRELNLPSKKDCAKFIVSCLKKEPILNHNNVTRSLSQIIRNYVMPEPQTEIQ